MHARCERQVTAPFAFRGHFACRSVRFVKFRGRFWELRGRFVSAVVSRVSSESGGVRRC